jgi:FKBP-type peptidyl-prolyl cis-trans isomerase FkpA
MFRLSNLSYPDFFLGQVLLLALIVPSCKYDIQPALTTHHFTMMDDSLINYNKGIVKTEDQSIDDFVLRYGWKMTKTSTGVRIMNYYQGNGEKAVLEKTVVFRYEVRLLNGDLCYSSVNDGNREIRLGHTPSETGLQEGILLMKVGDKAKIIVPSHIAFGLLGDQNKVPPRSSLIYDIELLKVK